LGEYCEFIEALTEIKEDTNPGKLAEKCNEINDMHFELKRSE
jgi:hypothetical protein